MVGTGTQETLDSPGAALSGLSAGDAAERLTRDGPNELPVSRGPSMVRRFAAQFADLFAVIAGLEIILHANGHPVELGSGVRAVEQVYVDAAVPQMARAWM